MTIRELYEWAKEGNSLDKELCISIYSEETRFGAGYEDYDFNENDLSTTRYEVIIQID